MRNYDIMVVTFLKRKIQVMLSKLRDFFRRYHRLNFAVVAFIVGILFTVVSIISFNQLGKEKVEVSVTVTRVDVERVGDSDETYVYVTYEDKEGVTHENVYYPDSKSTMEKGDKLTGYYNAANPDELLSNNKVTPYIFLAVGIFAIILAVVIFVRTLSRSKKESNELDRVKDEQLSEENVKKVMAYYDEPNENYYFHFTGKLNQSYILETKDKKAVMEARCDKIGIFSKYKFNFIDHLSGKEILHEVSHTISTSFGSGDSGTMVVDSSYFKIDGEKCWDYLGKLGYSLSASMQDLTHFSYEVKRYGVSVGNIKTAGRNVMKEGKQDEENFISVQGCYVVNCKRSDLEGFFAACFILSRVEIAF